MLLVMLFGMVMGFTWGKGGVKTMAAAPVVVTVPLNSNGTGVLVHECCDCSLVHRVEVAVIDEGVTMAWSVDTWETRKRRTHRGFNMDPPWMPSR